MRRLMVGIPEKGISGGRLINVISEQDGNDIEIDAANNIFQRIRTVTVRT